MEIKPFIFETKKPSNLGGLAFAPPLETRQKSDKQFTAQDLAKKENDGYQKGIKEGRDAGFAEGKALVDQEKITIEQNLSQAINSIMPKIDAFFTSYNTKIDAFKYDNSKLIIAIARKITQKELEDDNINKIKDLICNCSDIIFNEPNIIIALHKSLIKDAEEKIQALFKEKNYKGTLTIQEDNELSLTDCKIEWKDGGLEASKEDIWTKIDDIISKVA